MADMYSSLLHFLIARVACGTWREDEMTVLFRRWVTGWGESFLIVREVPINQLKTERPSVTVADSYEPSPHMLLVGGMLGAIQNTYLHS